MPDNVVDLQQATRRRRQPKPSGDKPFKFQWFDLVTLNGDLTHIQLRILTRLFTYADENGHKVFPRHEVLADDLEIHLKTVRRNLRELEALQWIACVDKGNRSGTRSKYVLRIPAKLLLPAR